MASLRGGAWRLYHGGPVHPWADERRAEALVVRGSRVAYVGDLAGARALVPGPDGWVDLEGRSLFPGFTDAHVHVWKVGQLRTTLLDLRGVTERADFEARVRARHA